MLAAVQTLPCLTTLGIAMPTLPCEPGNRPTSSWNTASMAAGVEGCGVGAGIQLTDEAACIQVDEPGFDRRASDIYS